MKNPKILIQRLPHGEGLPLPFYGTEGSSGADVCAAIEEPILLQPGERTLVPTGLKMELPEGYELQIRPRSGLSLKYGIIVLNTPATIDCDYRGELKIILINLGQEPFTIERGMRIAQAVLAPYIQAVWDEVEVISDNTDRCQDGFGSTGTHGVRGK